MRSRFSAFASKQPAYLWRTLHADHEDRARSEVDVLRDLRSACATNRYLGLRVLEMWPPDDAGVARVLFAARVFRKGTDISFTERSEFLHDGTGWRYLRGEPVPLERDT
jgi:SEC-C motif-containing protein